MLKNVSRLEHKIGDKIYHFVCDMDSSLPDVKDALFQFIKYIVQIEDQIKANQESQKISVESVVENKDIPKDEVN